MKRCPECRRDYYDDSLLFCLEDGMRLIDGAIRDEVPTAIMHSLAASESDSAGSERSSSIAVLPFVNISADPENEYFCDGLSEELLNALSHIEGLKVAARTSAFSFKGKDTNINDIAKKLGVRTILEGSVRKAGTRVRVTLQLTNAADGYHLWSERYDVELADIFDVQDQITLAVVDSLKLRLLGDGRTKLLKRNPDNSEAYSHYLRGRFFWNKRTTESTHKAIEFYQRAIDLDPNYALAYSGIADCYSTSGFAYDLGSMPAADVITKAKNAALRALEIDDSLAEAHTSLAYAKHLFDWDWEGAETGFRHALRLNPNYANARHWYAHLLMAVSRIEEALTESRLALELDPVSAVMNNHLGWHFMFSRDFDSAIAQLNHTLMFDPDFVLAHWYLGITYGLKGQYAEAEAEYGKATMPNNDDLIIRADVAHFYAISGQVKKARHEFDQLINLSNDKHVSSFGLAMICVGLADDDRAFEYFDKALQEHSDMLVYLNVDPRLDRVRNDRRFQSLVNKVGLPQQTP